MPENRHNFQGRGISNNARSNNVLSAKVLGTRHKIVPKNRNKHKQFGCVKPNKSGQTLVNIAKDLKLFYVNQLEPNRHTRDDPFNGTSDILDMAFYPQV